MTERSPSPPPLIEASHQPTDSLWAEVFHQGAYDLLSKPFESVEVMRLVSMAWLQWREQVAKARRMGSLSGRAQPSAPGRLNSDGLGDRRLP